MLANIAQTERGMWLLFDRRIIRVYTRIMNNNILTPEEIDQFAQIRSCAFGNLRQTERAINQFYTKTMSLSGLEPTQFMLLSVCAISGVITLTALAEKMVMDRTTLTRNLKVLEKYELVRVVKGDDRRVRNVVLTEKGGQKIKQALPLWQKAQGYVVQQLGQDRLNRLLNELSVMKRLAVK